MKLGFSTIGCPEWDWAEILGTAKDMGIDGIEIRGVEDELDPMKITIFDKEHLAKPPAAGAGRHRDRDARFIGHSRQPQGQRGRGTSAAAG